MYGWFGSQAALSGARCYVGDGASLERSMVRKIDAALIATGDEIAKGREGRPARLGPGEPAGKPPSNAITLAAWCQRFGLTSKTWLASDNHKALNYTLSRARAECDAIITIGGTGPGMRPRRAPTVPARARHPW